MEKITFVDNVTKANKNTFNTMQDNIEDAIEEKQTYSTEEKRIGTWVDGKPLYRKTIIYTGSMSANVQIAHNISNFGELVNYFGSQYSSNTYKPLPTIYVPNVSNYGVSLYLVDNSKCEMVLGTWAISNVSKITLTL